MTREEWMDVFEIAARKRDIEVALLRVVHAEKMAELERDFAEALVKAASDE